MMNDDLADMPEVPDVLDEDDEGLEDDAAETTADTDAPRAGIPALLAGLAAPLAPVVRPVGAVLSRVPTLVLSAVGSALAVVVVVIGLSTLLGGGSAPTATTAEAQEEHGIDLLELPIPTRPPLPATAPKPVGPTPTPTPALWEPHKDGGWIGRGYAGPSRVDMLKPSRLFLFDDRREAYTILTRFSILTATGPGAPLWGVALSYFDENNYVLLESRAGKERHPEFILSWQKDGNGGPLGPPVPAPEVPFWGRDTHELRISTNQQRIKIWLNDLVVGQWENKHIADGGQKGLFAWFGAVIRVESFRVQ